MSADAVVVVSHGTVDDLDDLGAFVTNVRGGRPPPPALVAELRRRYEAIGGSPLNAVNAKLAAKLEDRLGVPVARANRLFRPYVRDVIEGLARQGVRRVALVPLAQHSAHVYADDGRRAAEGTDVEVVCAPSWGHRADLHEAFARRIAVALGVSVSLPTPTPTPPTTLILTAHSLPTSIVAAGDPYERDFRAAASAVEASVRARVKGDLHVVVAFQSQGMADGPPIEWLGPDLPAAIALARAHGSARVVVAPIGFLADHVEVLYDLDVEVRALAEAQGMAYARAPSLNADDDFVDVLVQVARPLLDHG